MVDVRSWGGAGQKFKKCKVKKRRRRLSRARQGPGAAGPKHQQTRMRNKELRQNSEVLSLSREEERKTIPSIVRADGGDGALGEVSQGFSPVNSA